MDKNNASEILQDVNMSKTFLDLLVYKLEPFILRERLKMRRSSCNKSQVSKINLFKPEVSALAVYIYITKVSRELTKYRTGKNKNKNCNKGSKSPESSKKKYSHPERIKISGNKRMDVD